MVLFKVGGTYYTYQGGWVSLGSSTPSAQTFLDYGVDLSTVPSEAYDEISRPIEFLYYLENNKTPNFNASMYSTEIYWGIKINNKIYTHRNNAWEEITESEVFWKGMSKEELESIMDFSEIYSSGTVTIIGAAKSNSDATWWIEHIDVKLPESFSTGSSIIKCPQFNTSDWETIESIDISQTATNETDIRYAFSLDNGSTWCVYNPTNLSWDSISNIAVQGMTKTEVEAISNIQFNSPTLDIRICMINSDTMGSPYVSNISIDYTAIEGTIQSNSISIPIPAHGFRNVLIEGTYQLKIAEGIAFDDADVDFNFYTTPNKIKLRPLNMGEITGGRYSNVFAVEILNGYENDDFNITLYATKGGQDAEARDSYGLLYDAERESSRTRVEMSLVGAAGFNPTYPLTFRLDRMESKIFYIRIKPTLTTSGYDTFQVRLVGRAV